MEVKRIKTLDIRAKPHSDDVIKTHFETFNLEDQYKVHTDIAAEIIWKSKVYVDSYRDELENLSKKLGLNDAEIKRMLVGNYTELEDVHKRPLAKLTTDIAKDLGLI